MATPFRQLESVTSYTADGVTTAWNFSFSSGYLDKAHVKAYQLSPLGARTDIPVTLGMFAGAYQLTISPAIQAGYELTIYRDTPTSVPLVDFTDAAAFTEVALDTVVKQAVFAAAETQDALSVASARIDQIGSFAQGAQDARTAALASQAAANQSAIDAATYAVQALASKNAAAASALSVVDTNLVHLAGVETVTGNKTFSGTTTLGGPTVISGALTGAGVTKAAVGLGNVDNVADASKPVSTAQAAAIAATSSWRNKIRNSKMDIAQRGASVAGITGAAPYTLDGWIVASTGTTGVVTASQQADVMAGSECQNSLRVTVTTADATVTATKQVNITQPIEGFLVRDLLGNPIAIRFEVRSAKVGTHCVSIRNGGSDRSYVMTYNIAAANTWQVVTLSLPGGLISAGTWNFTNGVGCYLVFSLMAGANFQTTSGAWQTGNLTATAAQVNCMDTVGNVFAITSIQLERDRGQGPTALEHRDYATELLLNQRYYETGRFRLLGSVSVAGGYIASQYGFKTTKRVSPTMSQSVGLQNSGNWFSVPVLYGSTLDSVGYYGSTNTINANCEYLFDFFASAEL